ncbi:hypothetical protein DKX38_005024 [Salix brachista]|uniref:Sulfotransferase n=1 Tax=Salix brachista TaxID=2182728 RepID=A0A5N5NBD1_9ROSI|nr:hypothetical protein DKX38_005024 [Salix brachista]
MHGELACFIAIELFCTIPPSYHTFSPSLSSWRRPQSLQTEKTCRQMRFKVWLLAALVRKNWDGSPLYFYKGVWYPFFAIRGALSFQQHFIARDTDIILASMPKSGTTWLKALAFSVVNRSIYSPTESPLLTTPPHDLIHFFEMDLYSKHKLPDLEQLPSPRIFSSHSHYEAMPQSIRGSGCKIVYICRNPLDQLVSYFHFSRKFKRENVKPLSSIDEGFENVCRGIQSQGPFWDSVLV